MKWTIKLITEAQPGTLIEEEVLTIERADLITPARVGLSIAEGKAIIECLQRQIVTAQVQRHGASIESCPRCGKAFRTKGYYPIHSAQPLLQGSDADSALERMFLYGIAASQLLDNLPEQESDHTGA